MIVLKAILYIILLIGAANVALLSGLQLHPLIAAPLSIAVIVGVIWFGFWLF